MNKEELKEDILATIADRKKFAKRDFKTSETLLLIAIVSSFLAATLAINEHIDKTVVAILSGLSGIMVVIYQRVSYTNRFIWNELYRIDLQKLLTELEVTDPLLVAEKYAALQEKKQNEWSTKNFEL